MANKYGLLILATLLLAGCSYNLDTNGVYYKSKNRYLTECKQVSEYKIDCRSNGVAK
jgi:PBP1b-binding outer membrane lipoprotein LpoB